MQHTQSAIDMPESQDTATVEQGQDHLFAEPIGRVDDFNFGKKTAAVFDDMLNRSVPMYGEIERMVAELACDFAAPGSRLYDLGCSTCTSFLQIAHYLPPKMDITFIGLDASSAMLDKAKSKLESNHFPFTFELACSDLNQGAAIENASVVILNLTLQFVRPIHRDLLLNNIYAGMNPGAALIVVEKVLGENSLFNRLFIKHYYEMKRRNGYSEMEIAQKREALENVLIPYHHRENVELLQRTGFEQIDTFFKWYNFCGMVAVK